jgi:excisionase family DNA binding protein
VAVLSIEETLRSVVREAMADYGAPKEWLTPGEVAIYLGLTSGSTVYAKIRRGVIPAHEFDGRLYVSRSELDAVIRAA